jgi:hydrogenase maturation protease
VALARLREWGITPRAGRSDESLLADPAIRRDAYEAGRPSAEEACRTGDARFLPSGA